MLENENFNSATKTNHFIKAILIIILIGGSLRVAWRLLHPPFQVKGMIKAESLPIRSKSANIIFKAQTTKNYKNGKWTNNSQMLGFAYMTGDWIEFWLQADKPGNFRLNAYLTRASDYGVIQFLLDGKKLGAPIDLWTNGPTTDTGKITLGEINLDSSRHILRMEAVGKNPANTSPHYLFGMDGFVLERL